MGLSMDDTSESCLPALITQAIGTFLLAWVIGLLAAHNTLLPVILIIVTIVFLIIAGGWSLLRTLLYSTSLLNSQFTGKINNLGF